MCVCVWGLEHNKIQLVSTHHVGGENEDPLVFSTRPLRVVQQVGVVLAKVPQLVPCGDSRDSGGVRTARRHIPVGTSLSASPPTCVQAALVAVGAAQAQAAVAGVARLDEGGGGVDGVPPAPQHVGGIEELGVGDGLQARRKTVGLERQHLEESFFFCEYIIFPTFPSAPSSTPSSPITISLALTPPDGCLWRCPSGFTSLTSTVSSEISTLFHASNNNPR